MPNRCEFFWKVCIPEHPIEPCMISSEGAKIIGEFTSKSNKDIFVENNFGGKRILPPLEGSMLPRIC